MSDLRAHDPLVEFAQRARSVARRPSLDAAAAEALDALRNAGVEALLLKGVALARLLYRENEHRGSYDIDLLVAPEDFELAGQTLTDLGYVDFVKTSGLEPFAADPHAVLWTRSSGPLGPAAIDLHWRLPGCGADPQVVWDELRLRQTAIEVGGVRAAVPNRAGLALHAALHAAQHGPQDAKAIGDLVRAIDRWPVGVWEQAAVLAKQAEATETLSAGLRLLPTGSSLADQLQLPSAEALLQAIADRESRPRGVFHLHALVDSGGFRERARVLRLSLVPPRWWIVREHPLARRGRPGLLAGYAVHIACAPVWAVRAWRFWRRDRREAG
jgi:Uncharacterised nucleotidyltransferase